MTPPTPKLTAGLALLLGIGFTATAVDLDNYVVTGGGGSSGTARFHLIGSIGKPIAHTDETATDSSSVRAGFWTQVGRWLNIHPAAYEDILERRPGQGAHVLARTLILNDVGTELERVEFVSLATASAGGGSLFRDGPWIVYQPAGSADPDAEDSFEYTIRDAVGIVTTGTVRVRIAPPPPPTGGPNSLAVETTGDNPVRVRVRFHGVSGRSYLVQAAPDLPGPWTTAARLAAGSDGSLYFTEPLAPGPRYYRLIEPATP